MNSNIFIKNYLISHSYQESVFKRRLIRYTFLLIIVLLLINYINPFLIMRKQAIQNFSNFTTQFKKRLAVGSSVAAQNSIYDLPIDNAVITSGYGMRTDPISGKYIKHTGIDMVGAHRAPVHSIEAGVVTFAGTQNGFGNCIEISHNIAGKKFYSFYAHLSSINVKVDDLVTLKQVIGNEGGDPSTDPNPGYSTGHHLHFEIRDKTGYGNDVDPTKYLRI